MWPIKFRGWRTSKEWVYGNGIYARTDIHPGKRTWYIWDHPHAWNVFWESISRFTGEKDANGIEIYENDIIILNDDLFTSQIVDYQTFPRTLDKVKSRGQKIYVIGYYVPKDGWQYEEDWP